MRVHHSQRNAYAFVASGVVCAVGLLIAACADPGTDSGPLTGAEAFSGASSLAVMPFTPSEASDESSREFADGLHDDLVTRLAKVGAFRVTPRSAVLGVDPELPTPEIAAELGVDALLRGRVRRTREHLRVSVLLVDGRNDQSLWAETYDTELTVGNLVDLQLDIAQRVAEILHASLTAEATAAFSERPTRQVAAYECFLRGNTLLNEQGTTERQIVEEIEDLFRCAVAEDPEFGEAWAMLGIVRAVFPWRGWEGAAARIEAEDAIDAAFRLAPEALETRMAQGYLSYFARDYDQAARYFQPVYDRWRGDLRAVQALTLARRRQGDWVEAARLAEEAHVLDPNAWWRVLVTTYRGLGRYDEAVEVLEEALTTQIEPVLTVVREERFLTSVLRGDLLDAAAVTVRMDDGASPEERAAWAGRLAYYRRNWDDVVRYGRDSAPAIRYLLVAEGAKMAGRTDVQLAYADSAVTFWEGEERNSVPGTRDHALAVSNKALAFSMLGWRAEAEEAARAAVEAIPIEVDAFDGPQLVFQLAEVYVATGRVDEAFEALAETLAAPGGYPPELLPLDPGWDPIRDDPRFTALLRSSR